MKFYIDHVTPGVVSLHLTDLDGWLMTSPRMGSDATSSEVASAVREWADLIERSDAMKAEYHFQEYLKVYTLPEKEKA